jgi:hypothetical protein
MICPAAKPSVVQLPVLRVMVSGSAPLAAKVSDGVPDSSRRTVDSVRPTVATWAPRTKSFATASDGDSVRVVSVTDRMV